MQYTWPSVQNCIEGEHIVRILSPQLERKSRVQRSKEELEKCLKQINRNIQRNMRVEERSQGMIHCPLCLEERTFIDKQRDRSRRLDRGQVMKSLNARLWALWQGIY